MSLRIVIAGHVDHGKSTLIGRLLSDSGQIFPERIEKVKGICSDSGKKFEFAFLLDAFEEEQKEGITIDKTEIPWTYQNKKFLFIDTPGHKEFLKNMISGASTADAAIIMLDAFEGVREQFKRHAYIISMLGIKQVIVAVNKMDLVKYSQEHFEKIEREVSLILKSTHKIIPLSAFEGKNLIHKSDELKWFKGQTLAEELFSLESSQHTHPFLRFSLQDVYKFDENRIYAGKMESGQLSVGDKISFLPSGSSTVIKTIESWNTASKPRSASAGQAIGFTLQDPLFLERGEVGFKEHESVPTLTHQMHASLFWMSSRPLEKGKSYKFKMLTQETDCKVESLFNIFNPASDAVDASEADHLNPHEAGEFILKLSKGIVCDSFKQCESTGRFVLLDDHRIVGGGVILNPNTIHVFKETGHVTRKERTDRYGHQGAVLWLTGLSGAGKSTIAKEMEKILFEQNVHSIILDGDNLRKGICKDLGFSAEDRKENIRRIGEVAKLIAESGAIAIAALISPYEQDRQMVRSLMPNVDFVEIFVDCSLEECERRDTKGLYKKARNGEIKGFTGIDSTYEKPHKAELTLQTDKQNIQQCLDQILLLMKTRGLLK